MDAAEGHRQKARSSGCIDPRHVVIPSARDRDAAEAAGGQELGQRPPGEQAQVAGHHAPRPAVHAVQAHLGEDRLDARGEQAAVVPGGEVRRGQQQVAAGLEYPPDFFQRPVGVDQVLDQLAHDHHVGLAVGDRQARFEGAADCGEAFGLCLAQGVGGPVDPGHVVSWVVSGRGGQRGTVAAAQVEDHIWGVRVAQDGGQHPGLAAGAVRARAERDAGGVVKSLQLVTCCAGGCRSGQRHDGSPPRRLGGWSSLLACSLQLA